MFADAKTVFQQFDSEVANELIENFTAWNKIVFQIVFLAFIATLYKIRDLV